MYIINYYGYLKRFINPIFLLLGVVRVWLCHEIQFIHSVKKIEIVTELLEYITKKMNINTIILNFTNSHYIRVKKKKFKKKIAYEKLQQKHNIILI